MAGNPMRFDPFREVARFDPLRNVDDIMRDFALTPSLRGFGPEPRIRMDVTETDGDYLVKADVPGVKKEDIKVSIDGNTVTISAKSSEQTERKGGSMMCNERYYGEQYRSFSLPTEVDDAKAQAKYQDGVLELTLPKKQGAGTKQISIQ